MTLIKVLLHHWIKAVFVGNLNIQSTSIMQIFIVEKFVFSSNMVYEILIRQSFIIKKIHQ